MKLYFSPGLCSLAPHIVAREAELPVELVQVDIASKRTRNGEDFLKINSKGYVPALQLDTGEILTEVAVLIQYLADQKPEKKLLAPGNTLKRYQTLEWLNFIATELHKQFTPLVNPKVPAEWVTIVKEKLTEKLSLVAQHLTTNPYVIENQFTVADAYLFTVLMWCKYFKIDLTPWPSLTTYWESVRKRPAVQEALRAEGLLKELKRKPQ